MKALLNIFSLSPEQALDFGRGSSACKPIPQLQTNHHTAGGYSSAGTAVALGNCPDLYRFKATRDSSNHSIGARGKWVKLGLFGDWVAIF